MAKKRPAASPASSPASKRRRAGDEETAWYESYVGGTADYYRRYMDKEWGVPIYGPGRSRDNKLFELLTLEGAQAGLSWDTILRKREAYRRCFDGFDIATVAAYTPAKVKALLNSPGEGSEVIVKNRAKIESTVRNAKLCQEAAAEYGSFGKFMWSFVGGRPKVNRWKSKKAIPDITPEAVTMSKELKRRGFVFVGPTVCYALMQSTGMVNDHPVSSWQWRRVNEIVTRRFGKSKG
ncbi:guaA [Symbiodinium sp. CCMP2456]|nr:guaA [Symbiodinium sp. CCMP2456]